MNPISVTAEEIPAEIREKELTIAREKAREAGKPENLLDRIVGDRNHATISRTAVLGKVLQQ